MIVSGLNTDIERAGRTYHIQTESRDGPGPVVESRIFAGGEIVVRMTVSYEEPAQRWRLSSDDVHHALELQHWELVRKVRLGMLDDDDAEAQRPAVGTRPAPRRAKPRPAPTDFVAACREPGVRELLDELDRKLSVIPEGQVEPDPTRRR